MHYKISRNLLLKNAVFAKSKPYPGLLTAPCLYSVRQTHSSFCLFALPQTHSLPTIIHQYKSSVLSLQEKPLRSSRSNIHGGKKNHTTNYKKEY